jgi:hypothetical protein
MFLACWTLGYVAGLDNKYRSHYILSKDSKQCQKKFPHLCINIEMEMIVVLNFLLKYQLVNDDFHNFHDTREDDNPALHQPKDILSNIILMDLNYRSVWTK